MELYSARPGRAAVPKNWVIEMTCGKCNGTWDFHPTDVERGFVCPSCGFEMRRKDQRLLREFMAGYVTMSALLLGLEQGQVGTA